LQVSVMTDDNTIPIPEVTFFRDGLDKEIFFDAPETLEEYQQLARRQMARLEADLGSTMRPATARRRPRRPTLASALKEAEKAGKHVVGSAVREDGTIELKFADPGASPPRPEPRHIL
jgi:hypothetical protein